MSGTKLATRKVAGNMMRSDFTAKKIYELCWRGTYGDYIREN